MDRKELVELVNNSWKFDQENYPTMPKDAGCAIAYILKHIHLHVSSESGKLATILEQTDHASSNLVDQMLTGTAGEEAKMIAFHLILCGLKLAAVLGFKPEEIETQFRIWALREKHKTS